MTLLFFSAACDFCDGKVEPSYHHGYVIYRGANAGEPREEYVFRSAAHAEHWRDLMELGDHEVRRVCSEQPFNWRETTGTIKGLELADHLFTIFPDCCYEPCEHRAHLG